MSCYLLSLPLSLSCALMQLGRKEFILSNDSKSGTILVMKIPDDLDESSDDEEEDDDNNDDSDTDNARDSEEEVSQEEESHVEEDWDVDDNINVN